MVEPRTFITEGQWPDGQLTADAPPEVIAARQFAAALRTALDTHELSLRTLAKQIGVDHTTISRVLTGRRYCDIATLAKLESGLATTLWPGFPATSP